MLPDIARFSGVFLIAGVGMAQAQSHEGGTRLALDLTGQFSLGWADTDAIGTDDFSYSFLDVEGELGFDSANTFGLGFDLFGITQFEGEPTTRADVYLYYNIAPGRQFQLGHAQPATELFIEDETLRFGGMNENTLLLQSLASDSFVRTLSFSDDPALGFAYFGDYGQFEVAASAHFNQIGDGEVYSLAMLYNVSDAIEIFGAVEVPSSDTAPGLETSWWLGASYSRNGFTGELLHLENTQFDPDRSATQLTARYDLPSVDGLTLGAHYINFDLGTSTAHVTRIAAEYELDRGFVFGGHVEHLSGPGTDDLFFGVEASFRF